MKQEHGIKQISTSMKLKGKTIVHIAHSLHSYILYILTFFYTQFYLTSFIHFINALSKDIGYGFCVINVYKSLTLYLSTDYVQNVKISILN